MKILVFGANGGIGEGLCNEIKDHIVIPIKRKDVDFSIDNSEDKIHSILKVYSPDIVINATGNFADNDSSNFDTMFRVNVKSNWDILNYYRNNLPKKLTKIIMIGSTAYDKPRKNYALYASSKSSLFSLYQSACEIFDRTNVIIGLINPSKVYTKMISNLDGVNETNTMSVKSISYHSIDFFINIKKSSYITVK